MGVITPSTFDPLKRRCNVRLQQGVPIVDADLNELDDIRKFELRAYLKWFVGDGAPEGNHGFQIWALGAPAADDVLIYSGIDEPNPSDPDSNEFKVLHRAGRYIVDGLDVIIDSNIRFKQQPLYGVSGLGAPAIDPIPAIDGEVVLYLDVWERLVTIQEDPGLVHPALGTESCVRTKREWAVRARAGLYPPSPGEPDYLSGHSYSDLAIITRRLVSGSPAPITGADIKDVRAQALLMPPSTLIHDVLGVQALSYRRGEGRPLISMRGALNALLRGDLPGGNQFAINAHSTAIDTITTAALPDSDGNVELLMVSNRTGSDMIYASRVWRNLEGSSGGSSLQLAYGTAYAPHAARLPNGEVVVVYANSANSGDIYFRRAAEVESLSGATLNTVASNANIQKACFVAVTGGLAAGGDVVFFWLERIGVNYQWMYRRRRYTSSWAEADATWVDASGVALSATYGVDAGTDHVNMFHAAVDSTGIIWAAFKTSTNDARLLRFNSTAGTPVTEYSGFTNPPATTGSPFVLFDGASSVWFFWHGLDTGIPYVYHRRYLLGTGDFDDLVKVPNTSASSVGAATLSAAQDRAGGIWLFWTVLNASAGDRIWYARRDPDSGLWGTPRMLSSPSTYFSDSRPCAVIDQNQVLWLFWQRATSVGGPTDVYCRQMLVEL